MSEVFVFGSNLAGVHGAGAAKFARENHRARLGVGVGPTGSAYAIPTKDYDVKTSLPLSVIQSHADDFLEYAADNPSLSFRLTAIGCGLAGFTVEQIAPMFQGAPDNVRLPPEFRGVLSGLPDERFWSVSEYEGYIR